MTIIESGKVVSNGNMRATNKIRGIYVRVVFVSVTVVIRELGYRRRRLWLTAMSV